jgi:hypothetical protein
LKAGIGYLPAYANKYPIPPFFTAWKTTWEQIEKTEGNYRENIKGEKLGALHSYNV